MRRVCLSGALLLRLLFSYGSRPQYRCCGIVMMPTLRADRSWPQGELPDCSLRWRVLRLKQASAADDEGVAETGEQEGMERRRGSAQDVLRQQCAVKPKVNHGAPMGDVRIFTFWFLRISCAAANRS